VSSSIKDIQGVFLNADAGAKGHSAAEFRSRRRLLRPTREETNGDKSELAARSLQTGFFLHLALERSFSPLHFFAR